MPLKKTNAKGLQVNENVKYSGSVLGDGQIPLFQGTAPLATLALTPEQFSIPEGLAVASTPKVKSVKAYGPDGKKLTVIDDEGNESEVIAKEVVRFNAVDATVAQTMLDSGNPIDGLASVTVTIPKDAIAIQKLVKGETIVKPKECRVRLGWQNGFGGMACDRLELEVKTFDLA